VEARVVWHAWERDRIPELAVDAWRPVEAPEAPFIYRWR